jgi:hypothetical protein
MIGTRAKPNLAEALCQMLPGSHWQEIQRASWSSATFDGIRMLFEAEISGADAMEQAHVFSAKLGHHEFDLRRYFVADIDVAAIAPTDGGAHLTVDALLIEE